MIYSKLQRKHLVIGVIDPYFYVCGGWIGIYEEVFVICFTNNISTVKGTVL